MQLSPAFAQPVTLHFLSFPQSVAREVDLITTIKSSHLRDDKFILWTLFALQLTYFFSGTRGDDSIDNNDDKLNVKPHDTV